MDAAKLLALYEEGERDFQELNLENIDLSNADLSGSDFGGANFSSVNFSHADLSETNLAGVNFHGSDLSNADLSYANLCFSNAQLDKDDLEYRYNAIYNSQYSYGEGLEVAILSDVNLSDAKLIETMLCGVDLSNLNLSDADLRGANLTGANLTGVNLQEATLIKANLQGADLSNADLRYANIHGANLNNTKRDGAKFSDISCDWTQLNADKFELLCYDILIKQHNLKVTDIRKIGNAYSRDGGRDIVFEGTDINEKSITWIAQCKLKSDKGSLGSSQVPNIRDMLDQYKAEGFCILTSGIIDATLHDRLDTLKEDKGFEVERWSYLEIERFLSDHPEIKARYFQD